MKQTRKRLGYEVEDLCLGFCSEKKYKRIENEELIPNYEVFDFFIYRMGFEPNDFEVILSDEECEKLIFRNTIEEAVNNNELSKANELLEQYYSSYGEKEILEEQYVCKIHAIIEKQKEEYHLAKEWIDKAIFFTVKGDCIENIENKYLGLRELELFLLWAEIANYMGEKKGAIAITQKVLTYAGKMINQGSLKVKIYPKALVLLFQIDVEVCFNKLRLYEEALELFRREKVWFFSIEVMEILQELYMRLNLKRKYEQTKLMCDNLKAIFQEFSIDPYCSKQAFNWFIECGLRYYTLCSDFISRERKARNLSREEMIEGIYENPESLARIEAGKRMPTGKNLKKILERFGIHNDGRYSSLIIEDYELLNRKANYEQLISQGDYESARVGLLEIKEILDDSEPCNQQYILGQETLVAHALKEIESDEAEKRMRAAFYITSEREVEKIGRFPTRQEFQIINQVGKFLARQNKLDESIAIFSSLVEMYDESPIKKICKNLSRATMVLNLGIFYEVKGDIQNAETYVYRALNSMLRNGHISSLDNGLVELTCIKRLNGEENIEEMKKYLIEASYVSAFVYKERYAQRVKEYYESSIGEAFPM